MFSQTIEKLKRAHKSSEFATQTNQIFCASRDVLTVLSKENLDSTAMNAKYNLLIVGMMTLARLTQDWKYGKPGEECPKEGQNRLIAILNQHAISLLGYEHQYSVDQWYKCAMAVGQAVLFDKTVPLYPASPLFAKFAIDMEHLMVETLSQNYNRFCLFGQNKTVPTDIEPLDDVDRQYHQLTRPGVVVL